MTTTPEFTTKDSGERQQFDSGMVRDTQNGKIQFELALDGPLPGRLFGGQENSKVITLFLNWRQNAEAGYVSQDYAVEIVQLIARAEGGMTKLFKRYAELMTRGAQKYSARNWMQANGSAELQRFVASATRHFFQWAAGERDEDHAAAVLFNLNGALYVSDRIRESQNAATLGSL